MPFDVAGHPLLGAKAKALDLSAELPEQKALAEDLLGLSGIDVMGDLKAKGERAIALQINYQLESALFAEVYQRVRLGDRDYEYREPQGLVSQVASSLADQLLAAVEPVNPGQDEGWSTVSSLR